MVSILLSLMLQIVNRHQLLIVDFTGPKHCVLIDFVLLAMLHQATYCGLLAHRVRTDSLGCQRRMGCIFCIEGCSLVFKTGLLHLMQLMIKVCSLV